MSEACPNKAYNLERCGCTYAACDSRGLCCECIRSHITRRQLPGCCFPPDAEAKYDRSFEAFAKTWKLDGSA